MSSSDSESTDFLPCGSYNSDFVSSDWDDTGDASGNETSCDGNSECGASEQSNQEDPGSPKEQKLAEYKSYRNLLCEHLGDLDEWCDFASGAEIDHAPNPGLQFTGLDVLRFPLGHYEIAMLKTAAVQNDFKDPDLLAPTLTASKGVWEIPSERWEITNGAWMKMLDTLKLEVCSLFDVPKSIRLSPVSLILQEAGSNFTFSAKYFSFICLSRTLSNRGPVLRLLPRNSDTCMSFCHQSTMEESSVFRTV